MLAVGEEGAGRVGAIGGILEGDVGACRKCMREELASAAEDLVVFGEFGGVGGRKF